MRSRDGLRVARALQHNISRRYLEGSIDGVPRPPHASLAHGAAGVSYFLLQTGAIAAAEHWTALARRDRSRPGAFAATGPAFPDSRAKPWSLYWGEAGVWCVAALTADASADATGVDEAIGRLCSLALRCPEDELDVVGGAAGLLLGMAALVERVGDRPDLRAGGERLAATLAEAAAAPSPELQWLGAAHGWGGIAHALLRWVQATRGAAPPADLLARLEAASLPSGLWPRRADGAEVWPGWCHGSAGWVQLWTLAFDVIGDRRLLALAETAAAHAATGGGGSSLCCGRAGQAYAVLAMHRATADAVWLARARSLAAEAADAPLDRPVVEHSLWGGDVGVAQLLYELEHPDTASMPFVRRSAPIAAALRSPAAG